MEGRGIMNDAEWLANVPAEITNDPIWKLEVYRLALFAEDIGWNDILALSKNRLMWEVADQLHRLLGSISANLTEWYSRSRGLDRARFSRFPWVRRGRAETGITKLDRSYLLK